MRKQHFTLLALSVALAFSFAACNDDDNNTAPSSTSGTTAGTTAGTTSGSTAGTTSGTTSGTTAGTTSGTTAGTTSGTTAGTTSGTTSGTTAGTTSGTTAGTTSGTTSGTTTGGTGATGTITIGGTTSPAFVQCASQQGMFALVGATATGTGMVVYLGGGMPTTNGTYQISTFTGMPGPGQANIMATADQTGTNAYMAVSGQVQVTIVGGKVKATFANIPAMNPMNASSTMLSGSLNCN